MAISGSRLTRSELFNELSEMRKGMEMMITPFARFSPMRMAERSAWTPIVDVFEEGEELVVRADLPGIEPKDVKLMLEKDILMIHGERKRNKEIKDEHFFSQETIYGRFVRRIALQPGLKAEDMKASYRNGVLEVRLPKLRAPAAQEIPIEA
ncbi:MAG TPA: Hsp20/alpha crystallin family protein [Gemmatimonadota bacterium]|nr:Hsp20/alpha crystallin family protein [Gemmatimonadota bacterium]